MPETLQQEQELFTGVRAGDPGAFRNLYTALGRPLLYFGLKISGDMSEAEDAAAVAFEKLWMHRENMRSYAAMKSYLYTIVYHRSLDVRKARDRKGEASLEASPDGAGQHAEIESRIIQAEIIDALYRALEQLPPHQREILQLDFLENLSTREIALRQGKSEAYIRTTRARGLSALRRILRDQGLLFLLLKAGGII